MKYALVLSESDNVANVVDDVLPGDVVVCRCNDKETIVTAAEKIPFFFKIAVKDIPAGSVIVKHGEAIGKASADIAAGACVHVHNAKGDRGRGDRGGSNS